MIELGIEKVHYRDPWDQSFELRYRQFRQRRRKVAYYYAEPDYGTFRYRAFNMVEALMGTELEVSASFFTRADMPMIEQVIEQADVVVLCRARYNHEVARIIALARRRGCRLIYDVDDLVFDLTCVNLLFSAIGAERSIDSAWDFWFGYVGRVSSALDYCDGVIVTNEPLRRAVQARFDKPVSIVPNFLNRQQIDISDEIYAAKERRGFRGAESIHIGYFSGTRTHAADFAVVASALREILEQHPEARLRIVGYLDLPDILRPYLDRVDFLPIQDFVNLQCTIGSTDINLVPLQDNVFTNCKSELKYFESAIVGTVTVASPTFGFRNSIEHGRNGLLACAVAWEEQIERLLREPELHVGLARAARADAARRHTWNCHVPTILNALK